MYEWIRVFTRINKKKRAPLSPGTRRKPQTKIAEF